MDFLTLDDLRSLLEPCEGPRVSLFMPTHGAAPDNRQDPLQLKALLREAAAELESRGVKSADTAALLAPARTLTEEGMTWRPRPGGVAIFLCADGMRAYRTPRPLEPSVQVGERFRVRPLLDAVDRGGRFLVLALSQNRVALYRGDRQALTEVDLGDMPRDIAEALRNDGFDEQLQSHSSVGAASPGGGRRPAIFHGSGADTGITTRYVTEYVKRVAAGMHDLVPDRRTPLVLATVNELATVYRDADREHNIAPEHAAGSPDWLPPAELHAQTWPIAERALDADRLAALARFRDLAGSAQAATEPERIVPAAAFGRVDALLVSPGAAVWGSFDESTGDVRVADGPSAAEDDLIDLAAARTLANGGEIYTVDGLDTPVAAVLRY